MYEDSLAKGVFVTFEKEMEDVESVLVKLRENIKNLLMGTQRLIGQELAAQ